VQLPNPAVEVFAHGVDSLLRAERVHVPLYVMGCDHDHNAIDRLNPFSGHAGHHTVEPNHGKQSRAK
jgi:hypothetical protein